jgi:dihydrofolate synthase/folylpolyglutamate synthase
LPRVNYAETIEFLYGLRTFGAKLGLENTRKLAALAGDPHERLRFIHVAGTNGKGSTCAMLEAIYRRAGLRVGLFTSPHLVRFGERIQVDRHEASEAEICGLLGLIRPLLRQFPHTRHPTFFEVVTIMAIIHFARHKCDLVIWETGLGGRLDATNIVTPLASVITTIDYDHEKWLGSTIECIAAEKAGIIKEGIPVITGAKQPEALRVIADRAAAMHAPLTIVNQLSIQAMTQGIDLALKGEHQRMNAGLALATIEVLNRQIPVPTRTARRALAEVKWNGRLQTLETPSGQRIVLDGAHNISGARALANALGGASLPESRARAMIIGILADKDVPEICAALAPLANRIALVPVQTERTADPFALVSACAVANPRALVSQHGTLADAFQALSRYSEVVVTGSLYLIGEALEWFDGDLKGERRLNEWSQVGATFPQPATSVSK